MFECKLCNYNNTSEKRYLNHLKSLNHIKNFDRFDRLTQLNALPLEELIFLSQYIDFISIEDLKSREMPEFTVTYDKKALIKQMDYEQIKYSWYYHHILKERLTMNGMIILCKIFKINKGNKKQMIENLYDKQIRLFMIFDFLNKHKNKKYFVEYSHPDCTCYDFVDRKSNNKNKCTICQKEYSNIIYKPTDFYNPDENEDEDEY